ncbi:MAG: hypothetical protein FWG85_02075 [Bacteroidetes bacterium]|nr:hypothetical protein [Bacteroidota bacterium]
MKIKKFIAANMKEGTELIKKELGNDAVILSNRPTKTKTGMDAVEIVAGLETIKSPQENNKMSQENTKTSHPNLLLNSLDNTLNQKLFAEVNSIKSIIADVYENVKYKYIGTMTEPLSRIYKIMKDSDFSEDMCLNIIGKISAKGLANDYKKAINEARKLLLADISFVNLINDEQKNDKTKQIITFIGSAGCGKTTALIKIAIGAKLINEAKVLVISTDTFRVGATEQLQMLTGIAGINFINTYSNEELSKVLNEETKYDMIFIDTEGKNPNNKSEINDLLALQDTINTMSMYNNKTNLILSATSSLSFLSSNIRGYSSLDISSAIITRTDESFGLGNVITALHNKDIPISYFSNGQRIPDDIEQANNDILNEYLFAIR